MSARRSIGLVVLLGCGGGGIPSPSPTAPPADTSPSADSAAPDSAPPNEADTSPPTDSETEPPVDSAIDQVGRATPCEPGGVAYGQEGERLELSLVCQGAGRGRDFAPVEGSLRDGMSWEESSGLLSWTPGLDQAGRVEIPVEADGPHGLEQGHATFWIADAWDAPGNTPVDPLLYEEEHGLPVVHVERPPSTNSSDYVDSRIYYRGREQRIELKYRGAASLSYPKNSYTLKFPPEDEFEDEAEGFEQRRKIVLTTLFDDNSYLRQRLCYDIWNRLDPEHHAVQTMHAVVYINGEYEGLYLLGDHIDGEYLEDYGYREDGNLYKAVNHDADFYDKADLAAGYEKKEGLPESGPEAFADLEELVGFVAYSDQASFRAEIGGRIDLDEVMDWWALVRFTESADSAGKNSYLYNDPTDPGFHYAPWDFNHSLGQTWQTERVGPTSGSEYKDTNNLFRRILEDETLGAELMARWRSQLDGALEPTALDALIQQHVDRIDPSARRDWEKWEADYRSYGGWSWRSDWTSYEEELAYLRGWIAERWSHLDASYP